MNSWFVAYTSSFLGTEKALFDYLRTPKDTRLWIGTVESVLALAYIRFRTGAKFRFKSGFKIGNDHSHPVKLGEYQFNFQGIKRKIMGGDSRDLLNFKTPLFFSTKILNKLKPENREILVQLARESIQSLLDTYKKDIMATEALQSLDLILKILQEESEDIEECDEKLEASKGFLYVNDAYAESPLTKKNMELWETNINILDQICTLFRQAYEELLEARNPDGLLNEIRDLQEGVRLKLEDYLLELPKGN